MSTNVFERVRDYFQGIADSFEDEKLASKIFPNAADVGSTREDIFMEFLKRHIPARCDVIKGGFVFDAQGRESKQLDLIITNDLTLNFKNFVDSGGKSFAVIEGCTAVISIKSNLTKETLFDALNGFTSLPPPSSLEVNPLMKNIQRLNQLPLKIIFAFDGVHVTTAESHLEEYYRDHTEIPPHLRVDNIVVNKKWIIQRLQNEIRLENGTMAPVNSFYPSSHGKFIGSFALWAILTGIQTCANFSPQILFNFKSYDEGLIRSMHSSES